MLVNSWLFVLYFLFVASPLFLLIPICFKQISMVVQPWLLISDFSSLDVNSLLLVVCPCVFFPGCSPLTFILGCLSLTALPWLLIPGRSSVAAPPWLLSTGCSIMAANFLLLVSRCLAPILGMNPGEARPPNFHQLGSFFLDRLNQNSQPGSIFSRSL